MYRIFSQRKITRIKVVQILNILIANLRYKKYAQRVISTQQNMSKK